MIEVLKQALEALETPKPLDDYPPILNAYAKTINNAIASLRQAIAELESQEPVAYINVEKRIFEWAKLTSWETPTVVNLPKIPLYTHPPQRTEQEPVAHSVIAGVLFDFMGWLTSRKERIVLSSADNASPAVEAITEFARMRNLSLDDAKVQDWHTHPPQRTEPKVCCQQYDTCLEPCTPRGEHLAQRTWVGLTKEDKDLIEDLCEMMIGDAAFSTIEAILKGKNT